MVCGIATHHAEREAQHENSVKLFSYNFMLATCCSILFLSKRTQAIPLWMHLIKCNAWKFISHESAQTKKPDQFPFLPQRLPIALPPVLSTAQVKAIMRTLVVATPRAAHLLYTGGKLPKACAVLYGPLSVMKSAACPRVNYGGTIRRVTWRVMGNTLTPTNWPS